MIEFLKGLETLSEISEAEEQAAQNEELQNSKDIAHGGRSKEDDHEYTNTVIRESFVMEETRRIDSVGSIDSLDSIDSMGLGERAVWSEESMCSVYSISPKDSLINGDLGFDFGLGIEGSFELTGGSRSSHDSLSDYDSRLDALFLAPLAERALTDSKDVPASAEATEEHKRRNQKHRSTVVHRRSTKRWKVKIKFYCCKNKLAKILSQQLSYSTSIFEGLPSFQDMDHSVALEAYQMLQDPRDMEESMVVDDFSDKWPEVADAPQNVPAERPTTQCPNWFNLIPLQEMKKDPKYKLTTAPKPVVISYTDKINKINKINNDRYFSRINIRELSQILELDNFNINLTQDIEYNVLNVFRHYCNFRLGYKTWIRDTTKAERNELISRLHSYISTWYPELTKFKLEVIIRRGSYSLMQRRLRKERRLLRRRA